MKQIPPYWQDAKKKLQHIPTRHFLRVRDIGKALEIAGMGSTIAAIETMMELGILSAEQRGSKKEYYLND